MVRKKKAVWIDKELEEKLKEFILKSYNLRPDLIMTEICKQAIRFALTNPKTFAVFLLTGEPIADQYLELGRKKSNV